MSADLQLLAQECLHVCLQIAQFSDDPPGITRTYLSPQTHEVHRLLGSWMLRLGMKVTVDAAGNLRGVRGCGHGLDAPRLILGSHIDTVPNAGAFDGVLGVVLALALLDALALHRVDFDIEVIAFSEEEGVRFRNPFLGSLALLGELDDSLLALTDLSGMTLAEAIRNFGLDPKKLPAAALDPHSFAFVEFHIEQGPVLEDLNLGLGIVESIAGQSRYELSFCGRANHAGTTPMRLRWDALTGAAEWILAVERKAVATPGLVATVGRIEALPGASNVIPGEVRLSLDIRHADDATRLAALEELLSAAGNICDRRKLALHTAEQLEQRTILMHPALVNALEAAAWSTGSSQLAAPHSVRPPRMTSGAGHDAMVLARRVPTAMLFLRSPGGISHHPGETVLLEDVQAALEAGLYFLKHLDPAAIAAQASSSPRKA